MDFDQRLHSFCNFSRPKSEESVRQYVFETGRCDGDILEEAAPAGQASSGLREDVAWVLLSLLLKGVK